MEGRNPLSASWDPGGPWQLHSPGTGAAGETFGVATHTPDTNPPLNVSW